MINHTRFNLEMIQKFEARYPQIPLEILTDIVDVVLNRAPGIYFSFDMVQNHPEFCTKCGECCRNLSCKYFNGTTCDDYYSRFNACMEFPVFDINGEVGLMLECECDFAKSLAEMVLNEEIMKNMELLGIDRM